MSCSISNFNFILFVLEREKKEKKLLSARGLKTENTWREHLENEFVGLPLSTMEIKINIALTKKH